MQWSVRPFVRISLFYISGILLGDNLIGFNIAAHLALLIFCFLLLIGFAIAKGFTSYKYRWFPGLFYYSMVFLFGIYISSQRDVELMGSGISDKAMIYVGEIVDDPVETKNAVRVELRASHENNGGEAISKFNVLVYLEKTDKSLKLIYGDIIVFQSKLKRNNSRGNPEEFDYAAYLSRKGISFTTYLNNKQWLFLRYAPSNKLLAFAKRLRDVLLLKLKENSVFRNTYEVSAAILLGYDFLMDAETEKDFVRAGAMHVLCVSGLHVGVVFLIMSFLLNFLKTSLIGKYARIVLLLMSVWAYALLTGMSPSVQRASIMISFFIVGEGFSRLKDSYNTLAASAFVMLLFNPMLVYSLGFQLSYAAVIGIISIYQPVYNLLYFKNKAANYLWSILSVSIAAQIATFPIAVHYFHYFSNYFWLVNLFVIPLSFLIIMSGFVFFVVSWIPYLSSVFGVITSFLVYLLNNSVAIVEVFPVYGLDNIFMPWAKLVLVYLIIIVSFHLLFFKRILLLKYLVLLVLALMVFNTVVMYRNLHRKEFVVFNVNQHTVMEFVNGKHAVLFVDSVFLGDKKLQEFTLKPHHIGYGINKQLWYCTDNYNVYSSNNLCIEGGFFGFFDKKFFLLSTNDSIFYPKSKEKIHVDAVIVSGKRSVDVEKLRQCMVFNKIIISSSVPYWKRQRIKDKCKDTGVECFDVNNEGAFIEGFFYKNKKQKIFFNLFGD